MRSLHDSPTAPQLTDRDFRRFQELIHRASGIALSDAKRALIAGRLSRRLRGLGLTTYAAYLDRVDRDAGECTQMIDCICTNETRFFREPKQFDFLDRDVLPRWKELGTRGVRAKTIRAWSVACSTGEEPHSVAMLLRAHFNPDEGWRSDILASDLSTRALAAAKEAVWPMERAGDIPPDYLRAYMLRGVRTAAGTMRARPELQSMIEFRRINLIDASYPVDAAFDLILCRNVLIYFDRETKEAIIERLTEHLVSGGILLLGHAETLTGSPARLQHIGPAAYRCVS